MADYASAPVTRELFVIDKQNADKTWRGIASIWDEVSTDLLLAVLAIFKDNDPEGTYRLVDKTRTESSGVTVIG